MTEEMDRKIKDRIRKLLAKARGTENEAEALAFLQKATEMLQEYNLHEADLGSAEANEPLTHRIISSVDWNPWWISMIQSLSKLYFGGIFITQEIYKGKLRRAVAICGRPHNLDIVESMYEYLETTTKRLAAEYSKDRKFRLDFEKGCGMRISSRILSMAKEAIDPPAGLVTDETAKNLPALYKTELELASDFIFGFTGNNKARRSGHKTGSHATAAGRAAGDRVNLGGQIGGSSRVDHLLGNG